MSKSAKLKSKLKAADRRRKRRAPPRTSPPLQESARSNAVSLEIDVAGILTHAALAEAGRSNHVRDKGIVSALRCIKDNSQPNVALCGSIHAEMVRQLDRAGVDSKNRQDAAAELLGIAMDCTDPSSPDQFIRYLSLIAG